jgi:hypothetical protein
MLDFPSRGLASLSSLPILDQTRPSPSCTKWYFPLAMFFCWDTFPSGIYPNGGVRGALPIGKFLILRIRNKRFSLKSFHLSAQNSVLKNLRMYWSGTGLSTWLVLCRYFVGTCRYSEYLPSTVLGSRGPKTRSNDTGTVGNVRYDNGLSCRCVTVFYCLIIEYIILTYRAN